MQTTTKDNISSALKFLGADILVCLWNPVEPKLIFEVNIFQALDW